MPNPSSQDLALVERLWRSLPPPGENADASHHLRRTAGADSHLQLIVEVAAGAAEALEPWRAAFESALSQEVPASRVLLTAERPSAPAPAPPRMAPPPETKRAAKPPTQHDPNAPLLPNVRAIIGIGSGKGGVGKSTITANLALALAARGFSVGVLDADIYGPSQAWMMGLGGAPVLRDGRIIPSEAGGVLVASMGQLMPDGRAAVWRGPMIQQALVQLMRDVEWGALDFLLVDLPPGTGDIPLTLAQRTTARGVVLVSTPQEVALLDVRKMAAMFRKLEVPLLGLVENMSAWACPHCGEASYPFGTEGAAAWAQTEGIAVLAQVPFDLALRESGDSGAPLLLVEPEGGGVAGEALREAARRLAEVVGIAPSARV